MAAKTTAVASVTTGTGDKNTDEARKGKGNGNGGKGEHASRTGKSRGKGAVKMVNGDDEGEEADEEKEGTRKLRWADCEEEEGAVKEQQRESGIRQERNRALCGWMAVMRNRKDMKDQP